MYKRSCCPQSQGGISRSLFDAFLCQMSLGNYVARNCGCRLVGAPGSRAHLIPTTGARNAEEREMAVKLIVMYPFPREIEAFEKIYDEEHVPMAIAKLAGKTKMVGTRILGSQQGAPPFHRIAEVHFPSMEVLEACAASEGASRPSRTRCRSLPEEPRPP